MNTVYVLECQDGKYYVGRTKNYSARISNHFSHRGSAWTKLYKPIRVLKIYKKCDSYDEDKYTKMYMAKYGIDNVRGGAYSQIEMQQQTKKHIEKEIWNAEDRCFLCGEVGHFVNDCKKDDAICKISTNKKFSKLFLIIPIIFIIYFLYKTF
jgi:predicted GIY-YIG superfamily endonuclease